MIERLRRSQKAQSKSKSVALAPEGCALFGEPQLLEGEDAAAYAELLARLRAAVKPVDIIEEMFIADVVALEWEVLRWRRLKTTLMRARRFSALEYFLRKNLDYDLYSDHFADDLTEILQENFPKDKEDYAETLVQKFVRNEPKTVDEVNNVLERIETDIDVIKKGARNDKASELVQEYSRQEPEAVKLVDEVLTEAGMSMDLLVADALGENLENLDYIERLDRLTTVAEGRRNASLREIDRRRVVLGELLRRTVRNVEEGEFEAIQTTPTKGNRAA